MFMGGARSKRGRNTYLSHSRKKRREVASSSAGMSLRCDVCGKEKLIVLSPMD
jgi:hypothetical protein